MENKTSLTESQMDFSPESIAEVYDAYSICRSELTVARKLLLEMYQNVRDSIKAAGIEIEARPGTLVYRVERYLFGETNTPVETVREAHRDGGEPQSCDSGGSDQR